MSEQITHDKRTRDKTLRVNTIEDRQRDRYGGFNVGAALFGWLVATAIAILLLGLVGAITGGATASQGVTPNELQQPDALQTAGIISGIALLIVMGIAYYAGGYVAGRMSRFDGARQGFGVWAFGLAVSILLAILGTILGARYNVLEQLNLPSLSISAEQATTGGVIALLLTLIVTLLAAMSGGKVGESYHRKIDETATNSDD